MQADFTYAALPCFVVARDAPPAQLGAAVVAAADANRELDETVPRELSERWLAEVLDATGVKDWKTFAQGARLVHVDRVDATWVLTPMRRIHGAWLREKRDEGYEAFRTRKLPLRVSDDELGRELRKAFDGLELV